MFGNNTVDKNVTQTPLSLRKHCSIESGEMCQGKNITINRANNEELLHMYSHCSVADLEGARFFLLSANLPLFKCKTRPQNSHLKISYERAPSILVQTPGGGGT